MRLLDSDKPIELEKDNLITILQAKARYSKNLFCFSPPTTKYHYFDCCTYDKIDKKHPIK